MNYSHVSPPFLPKDVVGLNYVVYIMNVLVTSGIIKPGYCAWYQEMNIFHESNFKFLIAKYSKFNDKHFLMIWVYGISFKSLWHKIQITEIFLTSNEKMTSLFQLLWWFISISYPSLHHFQDWWSLQFVHFKQISSILANVKFYIF